MVQNEVGPTLSSYVRKMVPKGTAPFNVQTSCHPHIDITYRVYSYVYMINHISNMLLSIFFIVSVFGFFKRVDFILLLLQKFYYFPKFITILTVFFLLYHNKIF